MLKNIFVATLTLLLINKINSIEIGQEMPYFRLHDEFGNWRSSEEFRGKKLVIFFYPKDNSPICNSQIRGLRDNYQLFERNNITILGINYDSFESHKKLKEKFNLQFSLLSDTSGNIAKAFGADRAKLINFFPKRRTFIIENNKIKHVIKDVNVNTHAQDVLNYFSK